MKEDTNLETAYVIKSVNRFLVGESFVRRGNRYLCFNEKAAFIVSFHSSGALHCSYYVMPFFYPFQGFQMTFGDRLPVSLISMEKRPDKQKIIQWSETFVYQYTTIIAPFFMSWKTYLEDAKRTPSKFGFCPQIDVSEFMIYYDLYREDLEQARVELTRYEELLNKATWIHKTHVEREKKKIEQLSELIDQGVYAVKEYIRGVIQSTKSFLKIKEL